MDLPLSQMLKLVSRAGIFPGAEDRARLKSEGWAGWVANQLNMKPDDSVDVRAAISSARLNIQYEAGEGHGSLNEDRGLTLLSRPMREYWHLADWSRKMHYEERIRPGNEVMAATLLRASLSPAQLLETVTDFWRDHFSVSRHASVEVAISLPQYDEILRRHAFGNFRQMLEDVTASTAMLAYLNNASSRASPANENFARELMELHTLGAEAYLHAHFDRWQDVPGAEQGKPIGFIDSDVYEAARAFTGWTFANGQYLSEGENLPMTGEFTYVDLWHDPYQKRFLGVEIQSHGDFLADGKQVLDLVVNHPATARHVCTRLCQRFVSDTPSEALVAGAVRVFTDALKAPDQLAQVMQYILLSDEFAMAPARLQRPLFLYGAIQRSAGVTFRPTTMDPVWMLDGMGHQVYAWFSPAGHPLTSAYWQSPGFLVRRWRGMHEMWMQVMALLGDREWASPKAFAADWATRLGLDEAHVTRTAQLMTKEFGAEDMEIRLGEDYRWVNAQALVSLSASPAFQAV